MPIPSLLVGLGGTGQWVAAYVKKDLLETHPEGWPNEVKILAFDTLAKPEARVGGRGEVRAGARTTGAVELGSGEYFYVGGHLKQFMHEVVQGQHPHVGSWFLADWYLRNLPDHMFSITEGAGQFRQFGRLAVFRDVAAPANSRVFNTLQDALVKLKRDNPTAKELQVFLTGSLAGGTGAGMFVDVAHLIRCIAAQPNVDLQVTLRGFLILPDAFSQVVDPQVLRSMYARSCAAMRENRRFAVSFDYTRGYPMRYHGGGGHPVWHGAVKGRLFDLLYYLDGQRERASLSGVRMERGVAPTVADAIIATIDSQAGPAFIRYAVNVEQEATARKTRGEISQKVALFGTVGTYTIVFPIYHMIESWSHQLGLEVLETLLAPEAYDDKSGLPTALKKNANRESAEARGKDDAVDFMAATAPVVYEGKTVAPTLLMGELARISKEAARSSSGIVEQLIAKDIAAWNEHFVPEATDPETRRIKQRVERVLEAKLSDETTPSDAQPHKEEATIGTERIVGDARRFKDRYLGSEDPRTGQRTGGQYRDALAEYVRYHVARFNLRLDVQIRAILNGRNQQPGIAKGGKLGYLRDFLDGLHEELTRARDILDLVRETRQKRGDNRRNAIAAAQTARQTMEKAAAEKAGFADLGRTFKRACQAQWDYIQAEETLIDILQVEATEEAVLDIVNGMVDYVEGARTSVNGWADTLAFNLQSLYALLRRGQRQLETDRAADQDVAVRKIISAPDYEQERYEQYVTAGERDRRAEILSSLRWEIDHVQVSGRPKLRLTLSLVAGEEEPHHLAVDTYADNLALLLRYTRQPFENARNIESVMKYLTEHAYPGDEGALRLAKDIYKNSGPLLNYEGGNPLPANYLRAAYNDEDESQQNYLRLVLQQLAQDSGISTTATQRDEEGGGESEQRFVQYLNSEDRFKLSFVWTQELIELECMHAYKTGKSDYLGSADPATRGDRRILHIFPAEVNAAFYENRLPELKQKVRIFSDDVTLQLEDPDNVRLFLLAYAYGLINRGYIRDDAGSDQPYWRLLLPPETEFDEFGNPAKPTEIWLTRPGASTSTLLIALKTFNFEEQDVRSTEGYEQAIEYDRVRRQLAELRAADAQKRVDDGTAGEQSPDIQTHFPTLENDETTLKQVRLEAARLDVIRELQNRIEKNDLLYYQQKLPASQDDYDIASIFALMIRDEVSTVRQHINDRVKVRRGAEGASTVEPEKITTGGEYKRRW